jgi:hypothetical protein
MIYVVDVETDGPIPGDYSLLWIGAVALDTLEFFTVKLKPLPFAAISWEALSATGLDRSDFEKNGEPPELAMNKFNSWIQKTNRKGRPILFSDNNQFDGMFIAWYFHHFLKHNPFGYSSRRIGDLYCGLRGDLFAQWKQLRKTAHTHNPVDDAQGNAEALRTILEEMKQNKES